jgi:hypothetical protein
VGYTITNAKGHRSYRESDETIVRREAALRRMAPSMFFTIGVVIVLTLFTSFTLTHALLLLILAHVTAMRINAEA